MRAGPSSLLLLSLGVILGGCSSSPRVGFPEDEEAPEPRTPTVTGAPQGTPPGGTSGDPVPPPAVVTDDPGPAPTGCGAVAKDKNGYFTRTTAKSPYLAFVPKSYGGKPTTLVV